MPHIRSLGKTRLSLKSVSKVYKGKKRDVLAIDNINLDIKDGEIFCLVGASGTGKTTILNAVAGFISCTSGKIYIDGSQIKEPGEGRVMIFQDDATFPWLTVRENVLYGVNNKNRYTNVNAPTTAMDKLLEVVGLENWQDAYPKHLSGGMKKKVEIVRAFAINPSIILADEPFGGIDAISKEDLQRVILDLWANERKTILFATHDIEDALFMGDRIAVLSNPPGKVKSIIEVPFKRPRDFDLKLSSEFQRLRGQVKELLEKD